MCNEQLCYDYFFEYGLLNNEKPTNIDLTFDFPNSGYGIRFYWFNSFFDRNTNFMLCDNIHNFEFSDAETWYNFYDHYHCITITNINMGY